MEIEIVEILQPRPSLNTFINVSPTQAYAIFRALPADQSIRKIIVDCMEKIDCLIMR